MRLVSTSSPESEDLIRDYLRNHHSGVIATANEVACPHSAVVYYTFAEDFSIQFASKAETQKVKNMLENNQVSFTTYSEDEQTSIQITGTVEQVDDDAQKTSTVNAMSKNSLALSQREFTPSEKLEAGETVVFRLVPSVIRMGIFARPISSEGEYYETLLFSA